MELRHKFTWRWKTRTRAGFLRRRQKDLLSEIINNIYKMNESGELKKLKVIEDTIMEYYNEAEEIKNDQVK